MDVNVVKDGPDRVFGAVGRFATVAASGTGTGFRNIRCIGRGHGRGRGHVFATVATFATTVLEPISLSAKEIMLQIILPIQYPVACKNWGVAKR